MKLSFSLFWLILNLLNCSNSSIISIPSGPNTIEVDGLKEDNNVWCFSEFQSPWSEDEIQSTKVCLFHSSEYLYVHYLVEDKFPFCYENPSIHQSVVYSDRVEIFFTPGPNMKPYYGLEFDACNRLLSFKGLDYRTFEADWNFKLLYKSDHLAIKTDQGYQVEIRIPKASLRALNLINDDKLYIGLFRGDFSSKKEVQWLSWKAISTSKPDFHGFEGFQLVELGK